MSGTWGSKCIFLLFSSISPLIFVSTVDLLDDKYFLRVKPLFIAPLHIMDLLILCTYLKGEGQLYCAISQNRFTVHIPKKNKYLNSGEVQ